MSQRPCDLRLGVQLNWAVQCPERDSGRDRLETTGSGVSLVYDRAYDCECSARAEIASTCPDIGAHLSVAPFVGVRLSSTRYIRYGTVDVVLGERWHTSTCRLDGVVF